MTSLSEHMNEQVNPLDDVEQVLHLNNWIYDRINDEELTVKVSGKSCDYDIAFRWDGTLNTLQFTCSYDFAINRKNMQIACLTVMNANAALWIGHFEISFDQLQPSFRHCCLMTGKEGNYLENIRHLVDVALTQCERFRPVFQILADEQSATTEGLSLAMIEPQGEA